MSNPKSKKHNKFSLRSLFSSRPATVDVTTPAPTLPPPQASKKLVEDILSISNVYERRKMYWEQAFAMLSDKHKAVLQDPQIDRGKLDQQFEKLKQRCTMEPVFEESAGYKSKPIMPRGKLYNFLRKVERYCKIADIAIQHHPDITALVWAGIRFSLDLVLNDFRTFDAICTAAHEIPLILCSCEEHDHIFFPQGAKSVLTSIPPIYASCLKFTAEVLIHLEKHPAKRVLGGTVKPFEIELQPLVEEIKERKAWLEKLAVEANQLATTTLQYSTAKILRHLDMGKRQEILNSLSLVKPGDHHDYARRNRIASSGRWLFQKDNFVNWIEDTQSSVFWLYGQAGAGKTVLNSIVIDSLQATYPQYPVLYFYCNYKEDLRKHQESIIRTLYRDLAAFAQNELDGKLVREYDSWNLSGRRSSYLALDNVKELFLAEVSKYDLIFIVIDALDECVVDDRLEMVEYLVGKFLTPLEARESAENTQVKIFFTSRHDKGIQKLLEIRLKYEINASDTLKDIRPFVEERLTSMIRKGQSCLDNVPEDIRQEIVEALCQNANGMFLWVDFQLQTIRELANIAEVKKQLQRLPKTMEETYQRMLDQIDKKSPQARQWAYKTLMWVFGAKRPLSPEEIVQATAIQIGSKNLSGDSLAQSAEYLVDLCCHMIVIDNNTTYEPIVRFIHFSVQEFLESYFPLLSWHPRFTSVPQLLGFTCLTAIGIFHIEESKYPYLKSFYRYAIRNIKYYSDHIDERPYDEVVQQAKLLNLEKLFHDSNTLSLWNNWNGLDAAFRGYSDGPAFILAYYNLPISFKRYIEAQAEEISTGELEGLFTISILLGHAAIADILLTMRCNANFPLQKFPVLRMVMVYCKSEKLIQKLLDAGADVNAGDRHGNTALHAAAVQENEKLVQILLNAGANIEAKGTVLGTPLHAAAWADNEKGVQILLDAGADINAQDGKYGAPLQAAALRGYHKSVQLLLDAGADINAQGGTYGTALHAAAWTGNEKMMQILLDAGADVNAQGGEDGTPLQAAALSGFYKSVQILLDAGADINAQGGKYGTALHAAAYRGDINIVTKLLEAGADINSKAGKCNTVINAAKDKKFYGKDINALVKILVDAGAKD